MFQSITSFTKSAGHDSLSIHPMLTVLKELEIIELDIIFGDCFAISIPISFITCTTIGFRFPDGTVPALFTLNLPSVNFLKNASAIWLLPAFSTHTNRISLVIILI